MSSSEEIADLTSIISQIETKLSEITIDLESAKRNLAVLREKDRQEQEKTSPASSNRNRVLERLGRRSKREKDTPEPTSQAYSSPTQSNHVFVTGDRIKIHNPSNERQTVPGKVTGYTKDDLVKVKLDNGVKTRRASKNLVLIKKAY